MRAALQPLAFFSLGKQEPERSHDDVLICVGRTANSAPCSLCRIRILTAVLQRTVRSFVEAIPESGSRLPHTTSASLAACSPGDFKCASCVVGQRRAKTESGSSC